MCVAKVEASKKLEIETPKASRMSGVGHYPQPTGSLGKLSSRVSSVVSVEEPRPQKHLGEFLIAKMLPAAANSIILV